MIKNISNVVGSYYFLWVLWFKIFHRKKARVKLFRKNSRFYIGGFQRSGNTFAVHLLRKILGEEIYFVSHLHKSAVFKKSINLELPTFIIVREPYECVTSMYLKHFENAYKSIKIVKN